MMDHYQLYLMVYVQTKDEKILSDFHHLNILTFHSKIKLTFYLISKISFRLP